MTIGEEEFNLFGKTTRWYALFAGRLPSGEWVEMSRQGETHQEAYARLEAGLNAEGWWFE